jgi:hypothetical protein
MDGLKSTERIIDSVFIVNMEKDVIQSELVFTKSASYNNTWNNIVSYFGKYEIAKGVGVKYLRLDLKDNSTSNLTANSIYT